MSKSDKVINELLIQLRNIEYAGHGLAETTNQYRHKLIGEETKITAALLHLNDAANSVRDLIDKIESEDK